VTIYVSTGGYKNFSAPEAATELLRAGINNIELSGGRYSETIIKDLLRIKNKTKFQIHNYFPPPKNPFVFNLASLDKNVVNQSLAQVDNAIKTCVELGSNYYSFHAGFLCDLEVSELGKPIKKRKINDRKICTEVFIERVKQISKKAENKNVNIMIENNVLSFNNKKQFEGNPLLMCDTQECITIVKELPKNVKLLIDLAHLKVSANSLNFDPIEMIEKCKPYTGGYHLSDNDGTKDSNRPFNKYSWFWDYIKKDLDYYSIEVYDIKMSEMIELRNILNSKLK